MQDHSLGSLVQVPPLREALCKPEVPGGRNSLCPGVYRPEKTEERFALSVVKEWLDTNGFYCERQRARLSFKSCEQMREDPDKLSRCYQCNEYPKRGVKMIEEGNKVKGGLNKGPSMPRPPEPPKGMDAINKSVIVPPRAAPLGFCTAPGCSYKKYREAVEMGEEACYRHWSGKPHLKGAQVKAVEVNRGISKAVDTPPDRLVHMFVPEGDCTLEIGRPTKKMDLKLSIELHEKMALILKVNRQHMRNICRADIVRIMLEDGCQRILDAMRAKGLIE